MPGSLIYKGPSRIDGQPIVVVATWASRNIKTGDMLQTYILREDIDPLTANKLGEDYSICGSCTLRGTPTLDTTKKQAEHRACYVTLVHGPLIVWKQLQRGRYPDHTKKHERAAVGKDKMVRIGTYGDGAAAPDAVWEDLLAQAKGHTAYTHNGGNPQRFMVSADSLADARIAWASGYRTFRIVTDVSHLVRGQEIVCPSDKGVQCVDCGLCSGSATKAKSIAIKVHGFGAKYF